MERWYWESPIRVLFFVKKSSPGSAYLNYKIRVTKIKTCNLKEVPSHAEHKRRAVRPLSNKSRITGSDFCFLWGCKAWQAWPYKSNKSQPCISTRHSLLDAISLWNPYASCELRGDEDDDEVIPAKRVMGCSFGCFLGCNAWYLVFRGRWIVQLRVASPYKLILYRDAKLKSFVACCCGSWFDLLWHDCDLQLMRQLSGQVKRWRQEQPGSNKVRSISHHTFTAKALKLDKQPCLIELIWSSVCASR